MQGIVKMASAPSIELVHTLPLKKHDPTPFGVTIANFGRYGAHFGDANSTITVISAINRDDMYENATSIT